MNYIIRDIISTEQFKKILSTNTHPITISGIVCVEKSALACAYSNEKNKPVCIVTYNEIQAKKILNDLRFYEEKVDFFPKREISVYDYDAASNDTLYDRINVLNKIYKNKTKIIVTTIEAVMQNMISKNALFLNTIKIKTGDTINFDNIKQTLKDMGYERTELIEGRGQFSSRGDILDISINAEEGIRIELWGDEVDSIRKFRISSQRSTEMLKNVEIFPAKETILDDSIDKVCERIEKKYTKGIAEDIEIIREGDYTTKIDKYFNEFYISQESIIDYLEGFEIFIDEPEKIQQRISGIIEDSNNLAIELADKNKDVPESLVNLTKFKLKYKNVINLKESDSKENHFNLRQINFYKEDINNLSVQLENYIKGDKKVLVLAGTEQNAKKIKNIVSNSAIIENLDNLLLKPGQIAISTGSLSSGFENIDTNLIVISGEDFSNTNKAKKYTRVNDSFKSGEKIVFADLKVGDLIVHKNYGIGIFDGIKTIQNDGVTKDYISLKYRDGDGLYVPTDALDNVRKYIGSEAGIRLNKLGTKEWQNTKTKVKGNLRAVAKELIELYAKREHSKGFAFSKDTPWQNQFESSFPYQETSDQLRCINEVKHDMESDKPMDRLLCGDVGYGKTEVAIRAAFKAVMDSKQVAYLAPTTVLANQQYKEFKERMKEYSINVELLNRFRTAKQQKEIIQKLKEGKIDVIIGTHRVLSKDVEFKNLGLLIIDEEHRFGVKDKEKIKQYKENIDVLTMTATPIPRTMQMSIVGIRDMSVIYEPPQDRKPVQTYVLEYDKEIIREAITKELERGGQVFYIYNIVESIAHKAMEIEKLVPEAKIAYAHGQMSGQQIEEIMQDFIDKKTNVLVCTTILESGIDIPNANTMIIENADRFGLSQLYQIRGRVGRSERQAYAYVTYRRDKMISEDASQRLKAIKEFTEFGSGFKIATRDLQIRGAGSIFGEMQHGHIEQVGYDMYSKLLDEVVREEKGEKPKEQEIEISIDINVSSFIPSYYIEDSSQKIEIYQDIANSRTEEDIQNIIDEIIDRYGEMPKEVNNLIEIARIKNICRQKNVIKVQSRPMGVVFIFSEYNVDNIPRIVEKYKNKINFSPAENPYVTLHTDTRSLKEIKDFLSDL